MTQAHHVFRKDLRRLRWDLIAFVAVVGARLFIDTVGADIALRGIGPMLGIDELSFLLSLLYALLLALIVSRLVHDEPLVGRDAFWITRPISPWALLTAKLAFAALFLILVPLAAKVATAAAFGTPFRDVARAVPVFLLNQLFFVTMLMALTVLTPSLTRYVLAILGVIGGFVLLIASVTMTALLFVDIEESEGPASAQLPDPTGHVIGVFLLVLAAFAVIIYQYRRRRLARALAITVVGAVVSFVVPDRWPWSFAIRPRFDTAAGPDVPELAVSLDTGATRATDVDTFRRRTALKRDIATRATVAGVPPEFNVSAVLARSKFELPGGAVLEFGRRGAAVATGFVSGSTDAARRSTVEAALGGARLLTGSSGPDPMPSGLWPTLLRVDEADFVRHRSEAGRLTADLHVMFERAVVRTVLPIEDGAVREIDSLRVRVVRVIRRATGCSILLRQSHVEPLFSVPQPRNFLYVLRNAMRGEAAGGRVDHLSGHGAFSSFGLMMTAEPISSNGFEIEQFEILFPDRMRPDSRTIDLDDEWIRGSELVMLEMIPAGHVTRTVSIDGFRMAPEAMRP